MPSKDWLTNLVGWHKKKQLTNPRLRNWWNHVEAYQNHQTRKKKVQLPSLTTVYFVQALHWNRHCKASLSIPFIDCFLIAGRDSRTDTLMSILFWTWLSGFQKVQESLPSFPLVSSMCKPPKKSHGAPVINRPDNILQEDYTLPMDPWPLSQKVLNPLVIIPQSHY